MYWIIFFKSVNSSLPEKFQTVSEFLKPTVYESKIVNKVLAKQKVVLQDFSIKTKTGSFFVSHDRNVVIKPFNLNLSELLVDEINDKGTNSFFKLVVSFSLPKGSYATLITKRLFNQ